MQETVAVTDRELPLDYTSESPFGNLLAQAVRRFAGTGISIVNTSTAARSAAGGRNIRRNASYAVSVPGQCVHRQAEREGHSEGAGRKPAARFLGQGDQGLRLPGEILGSVAVDGLEVLYDPVRIPYDRIVEITHMGEKLLDEQEYEVGTLDMFTFGIGYESLALGSDPQFLLPEFLRDLLRFELVVREALRKAKDADGHSAIKISLGRKPWIQ